MKTFFLNTWLALVSLSAAFAQKSDDSRIYTLEHGKVIVWEFNGVKYGAVFSEVINTALDTQGRPIMFLKHSGYSSDDPDGKNVLLNFSFVVKVDTLTPAEKKDCDSLNVSFNNANLTVNCVSQVDLTLNVDPMEEIRLRQTNGFPMKINPGSTIPVQIKWQALDGKTVYSYLTDPKGLSIQLTELPKLKLNVVSSISFNKTNAEKWWQNMADDKDHLILKNVSVEALIKSLCDSGVFQFENALMHDELVNDVKNRMNKLLTRVTYGKYRLNKNDFFSDGWNFQQNEVYNSDVDIEPVMFQPGIVLKANPSFVSDLTTNENKGIDIFIQP